MSAPTLGRNLLLAATVIVIATLAAALWVMESPSMQRDRRLDQRRIDDLQQIEMMLRNRFEESGRLPPDLATLAARPGIDLALADPETGQPYGYRIEGPMRFALCADFRTDTATRRAGVRRMPIPIDWAHGVGNTCFKRRIEPHPERPTPDVQAEAAKHAAAETQRAARKR